MEANIRIHTDNTKKQEDQAQLPGRLYPQTLPPDYVHELEMFETIEEFEDRAWSLSNKGFTTGFPMLDASFEKLQPGFHVIGGDSNIGKSSFITALAWNIATQNNDAYVMDFSLDDPIGDKLARVVAYGNKIIINAVKTPNSFLHYPNMIQRRNEGVEKLRNMSTSYKAFDSNHSCDIEKIAETISIHMATIEHYGLNKRIVVFIDNFHDLVSSRHEGGPDKNKYDFLAQKISEMANHFSIPIVCSAEFRKLNGFRRPTIDDIRESVKIKYEAKTIMLCYNEVGIKGEAASVYFEKHGTHIKQPIFEVKIAKNKLTSSKARLFYEFYPEMAYFEEVDQAGAQLYNNLIFSNS